MTDGVNGTADRLGLLAAFLASLVAIFVGPLEAAVGLALYWLIGPERGADEPDAE